MNKSKKLEMKNNVIICDVDNVIFNFSKRFKQWMLDTYDIHVAENPTHYSFLEYEIGSYELKHDPEFLQNKIYEFVDTNKKLSLMDNHLPILFSEIRKRGVKIILLTAYSGDQEIRIQNLKDAGIEYDDIIFDYDKIPIIKKINPILVIEDKPKTILKLNEIGQNVAIPSIWNYCQNIITKKQDNQKYIYGYKNTKELEKLIFHLFSFPPIQPIELLGKKQDQ